MATRDKSGDKKSNFFREVKTELKKVVYPTPKTVQKNTLIVISLCIVVGVFIWALDWGFGSGRNALINMQNSTPSTETSPIPEGEDEGTPGMYIDVDENGNMVYKDAEGNIIENPEGLEGLEGIVDGQNGENVEGGENLEGGGGLEDIPTVGGEE